MADFFREVDEDVRRDQLIQVWKQYQNWIIGAALLIVVGTAAWRIYDYFQLKAAEAAGARYQAALDLAKADKNAEAAAAFGAVAQNGPKGYAALARLAAADAQSAKDPKGAAAAYEQIAADPAVDPAYQDVARLRGAYLNVDLETPKQFAQHYAAYAGPDSPYRNAFRELIALADARDGDFTGAAQWLEQAAADPTSPAALRARADAFLTIVQAGAVPAK
ncbi:MAG: tetratricopeptide repeat protein [Methylovirgula sp.]|nr:tetratricopeptide repeat protein [Methylovirgula sp.]